jgi:hypothetical protein
MRGTDGTTWPRYSLLFSSLLQAITANEDKQCHGNHGACEKGGQGLTGHITDIVAMCGHIIGLIEQMKEDHHQDGYTLDEL